MSDKLIQLDRRIAEVVAERTKFGLASQSTCNEIEDRLEELRERRVELVKKLEQEDSR
jgi:hypothetical protein